MSTRRIDHEIQTSLSIAYIHGRIEAQLEAFAASLGVPASLLTQRVGQLLLGPPSREVLGPENSVSSLPSLPSPGNSSSRKVAVVKRSPDSKAQARAKIRAYWDRMSPEERRAEIMRRREVWLKRSRKK